MMPENKTPKPDAETFVGALIETARDAAAHSSEKINHNDPNVQKVMRDLYTTAFVDGAMHVIKNELDDRIAETFTQMNRRDRRAAQRKSKK